MSAPRLVTVDTVDHGQVTVECPAWCIGNGWQVGRGVGRNDIAHNSVRVKAAIDTYSTDHLSFMAARITWAPFVELVPRVFVELDLAAEMEAEEVTHLAGVLRTAATRLESVAAEAIRMRGDVL